MAEILRRLITKEKRRIHAVLMLCGGLAGANGGVHALHSIWETYNMEDDWRCLVMDARDA